MDSINKFLAIMMGIVTKNIVHKIIYPNDHTNYNIKKTKEKIISNYIFIM